MKRAAFLLGLAVATPSVARAQIPAFQPEKPAPARPPAAPGPKPTPDAAPEQKAPPGEEYYVEPAPAAAAAPAPDEPPEPAPFEPPPPEPPFFEPPPPPAVRHLAPQTSLWLGARIGWFFPFGNAWAKANPVSTSAGSGFLLQGVPWRDYASSGPTFELDAGLRLSRAYTVFALWERAQLGAGSNDSGRDGAQDHAESDFWAVGLRASSNPDRLGFLTEVAVGYRRARTVFENDVEYQFTDAPFEARLGLGAELRLNRLTSLSSLLTVGVGGFGSIERVPAKGPATSLTSSLDQGDGHAWATLTIGGHFDLIRSAR
jgi:hypothetical protein